MYEELSKRQLEVLMFIKKFIQNEGYPPVVREICDGVNLRSTSSVHNYLNDLERLGYIRRHSTKPRALEILDSCAEYQIPSKKTVDIPVVGVVTAGTPILAVENISETFPMPVDAVSGIEPFMIKVHGDSMMNVGIYSGDMAIINRQSTADNGDIVLALIDDEFSTLKTFYKENNYYRLQPENDSMSPIISRNVKILGKMVGLIRFFR